LRQERDAIRSLDGARVLAFAQRKEEIMGSLRGADGSIGEANAARLRTLLPALKQNTVLLAHARDILRDGLAAVGVAPRGPHGGGVPATARRMLSIRA
jgi:hypothetical protein